MKFYFLFFSTFELVFIWNPLAFVEELVSTWKSRNFMTTALNFTTNEMANACGEILFSSMWWKSICIPGTCSHAKSQCSPPKSLYYNKMWQMFFDCSIILLCFFILQFQFRHKNWFSNVSQCSVLLLALICQSHLLYTIALHFNHFASLSIYFIGLHSPRMYLIQSLVLLQTQHEVFKEVPLKVYDLFVVFKKITNRSLMGCLITKIPLLWAES